MSERTIPEVVVDERIQMGVYLAGIGGAMAAAYHASRTGNPFPLFGACAALALLVLFVTSGGAGLILQRLFMSVRTQRPV